MIEPRWVVLCLAAGLVPLAGCVRRTIEITSTPSDALVWVNHAEVGRTPFSFEFTHDGVYAVRIYHEDCIPLATHASTEVPVWDLPGFDVVAELAPSSFERVVEWHFELEPLVLDPQARVRSALALQARLEAYGPTLHATTVVDVPGDGLPPVTGTPTLPPDTPPQTPAVSPPPSYPPDDGVQIVE
ncbi:MAG: PEGA domain-containing protein [Planctomycetota bacterium]|nr:PEGA domain-containing protein [Planctomycetota bacterium]